MSSEESGGGVPTVTQAATLRPGTHWSPAVVATHINEDQSLEWELERGVRNAEAGRKERGRGGQIGTVADWHRGPRGWVEGRAEGSGQLICPLAEQVASWRSLEFNQVPCVPSPVLCGLSSPVPLTAEYCGISLISRSLEGHIGPCEVGLPGPDGVLVTDTGDN